MATPDGLRWLLAGLMLVVTAYHATRLTDCARGRTRGRIDIDIEVMHFAMGLAMAVMLVAALPRLASQVVAGVFLAALAWFVSDAIHSYIWDGPVAARAPAQQIPICAAMAYMLLAPLLAGPAATMPGMAVPAHSAEDFLAPVLAVVVALAALAAVTGPLRRGTARSAFGLGCQLAMTGTAVVMLAGG
jgi:hypothetical protein